MQSDRPFNYPLVLSISVTLGLVQIGLELFRDGPIQWPLVALAPVCAGFVVSFFEFFRTKAKHWKYSYRILVASLSGVLILFVFEVLGGLSFPGIGLVIVGLLLGLVPVALIAGMRIKADDIEVLENDA